MILSQVYVLCTDTDRISISISKEQRERQQSESTCHRSYAIQVVIASRETVFSELLPRHIRLGSIRNIILKQQV